MAQRTLALSLSRLRRLRMASASPRLGEPVGLPSPREDSAPEGAFSMNCIGLLVALLAEGREFALPWEAARPMWASAASTACRGARMGSVGRPSPSCGQGLIRRSVVCSGLCMKVPRVNCGALLHRLYEPRWVLLCYSASF